MNSTGSWTRRPVAARTHPIQLTQGGFRAALRGIISTVMMARNRDARRRPWYVWVLWTLFILLVLAFIAFALAVAALIAGGSR